MVKLNKTLRFTFLRYKRIKMSKYQMNVLEEINQNEDCPTILPASKHRKGTCQCDKDWEKTYLWVTVNDLDNNRLSAKYTKQFLQ